ncbi:MAG TPA: thioredoxin domain-containing protein [Armatimonadota bacterium]|jgi:hypothetical protein
MVRSLLSDEERAALPPDGGARFNRLIFEKSPYLLLHAENPVDWYPWGQEALDRARREDKCIFLSLGYAACHWCHVMERESFARPEVAELLNENYVAIKVDREERPDLDEIYMHATHLLTGAGGWPNNLWLTPDQKPWFAGTYFPREDHPGGQPGFKSHLRVLGDMWRTHRRDVEKQSEQLTQALQRAARPPGPDEPVPPSRHLIERALQELEEDFDRRHGGFGKAPKFPPHNSLRLLLYEAAQRPPLPSQREMITATLDAMAAGGLRDHVGGGFHRYCLGAHWIVPHFEKMLYDNALLLEAYLGGLHLTGEQEYRRVAAETAEWALREMQAPGGGFCSALDAESEGQEGKYYLWRQTEVEEALGPARAPLFVRVFHLKPEGNFRDEATGERTGENVLYRERPWSAVASQVGQTEEALRPEMDECLRLLAAVRAARVRPARDDKVLASGNGLMIGALAQAGVALSEPRYTQAAAQAADFALSHMQRAGRLLHVAYGDEAAVPAYLDDYACLADGLWELHRATGEPRWLHEAQRLAEVMLDHFRDVSCQGMYFTADDQEPLLVRMMRPYDEATPAGNAVAIRLLVRLGQTLQEPRYLQAAEEALDCFSGALHDFPLSSQGLILAASTWLDGSGG